MLNVDNNHITRKGIDILCDVLTNHNTSIKVLSLGNYWIYLILYNVGGNQIGDEELNIIYKMMEVHPLSGLALGNIK